MLPKGGVDYSLNWTDGMSENFTVNWDLNELAFDVYDSTRFGIVVFIQNDENEGSKEIYQAAYEKLPILSKDPVITGLEDEINVKKFESANIYPIPAQNYFNVALSDQLTIDLDWKIIDQRGVQLLGGTFRSGEDTFEVDTNSLPNGLHMFIISSSSDFQTIRKIIIQR